MPFRIESPLKRINLGSISSCECPNVLDKSLDTSSLDYSFSVLFRFVHLLLADPTQSLELF